MVQGRAIKHGLIGPQCPRVIDLDLSLILALVELIVCEDEKAAAMVADMYARAKPAPPVTRGDERRQELARFAQLGR